MFNFFKEVAQIIAGRDDLGDKIFFRDASARRSAARFSRGNIAIQEDAFVTKLELEREREAMARHSR